MSVTVICPRCLGTGHYSYHMTKGTVCFKCDGFKEITYTDAEYAAMLKRRKAADVKAEMKAEHHKAIMLLSQQVIAELIKRYEGTQEFVKRTAYMPDSEPLRTEAAIMMFKQDNPALRRINCPADMIDYL